MELDDDLRCKFEEQKPFVEELLIRYKNCTDKYDRETLMWKILDVLDPFISEMFLRNIRKQFNNFVTM